MRPGDLLAGLLAAFLITVLASPPIAGAEAKAEERTLPIEIELASGTPRERQAEAQLRRLLAAHDLDAAGLGALIVTRRVRIESGTVPHSHPVLTLNTRHLGDDERQLATFLHEQLHWYLNAREAAVAKAIAELRRIYPQVPVGPPEGARRAHSSYLHLIIGVLERDALARLLGRARAEAVIARIDIYTRIYETVLKDKAALRAVAARHGLALPPE